MSIEALCMNMKQQKIHAPGQLLPLGNLIDFSGITEVQLGTAFGPLFNDALSGGEKGWSSGQGGALASREFQLLARPQTPCVT